MVKPASEGGAGFDTCYHDALRDTVRRALAQASAGAGASADMTGIATALWPPSFDQSWRFVQNLETHDEVLEGRKPRIARLADPGNARSWHARSRARVAAGLLLTAPGTPRPCSADFQSAVSQVFNLRTLRSSQRVGRGDGLSIGNRRYSRLEICATTDNVQDRPNLRLYWDGLERAPGLGGDKHISDFHRCVRDLIHLRHRLPALRADGFRVFHVHNANRVIAFHRWVPGEGQDVVIVANLSEHTHYNYQLGFPLRLGTPSPPLGERARGEVVLESPGHWEEVFNSDVYDHWVNPWVQGNGGGTFANSAAMHGFGQSAAVTIPANSILAFA